MISKNQLQSVCESQSGTETSPNFLKKLEPDLINLEPDLKKLELSIAGNAMLPLKTQKFF